MRDDDKQNIDPLFQIFEHHLLTRSYEDAAAFTREVAEEYLAYVDSTLAHLPLHVRQSVLEDLIAESHEMLVKKMYGCMQPKDYANFGKVIKIRKGEEFSTFDFASPLNTEASDKDK